MFKSESTTDAERTTTAVPCQCSHRPGAHVPKDDGSPGECARCPACTEYVAASEDLQRAFLRRREWSQREGNL